MLTNEVQQLLVAYVDGELSARQHEAASRLLQKSAEARDFVRQLEEDAGALRRLPRRQLGAEFPHRILDAIGERRRGEVRNEWADIARQQAPLTAHQSPLTSRRRYLAWAVAAAVLMLLGGGTLYYVHTRSEYQQLPFAKNNSNRLKKPADDESAPKNQDSSATKAEDSSQSPFPPPPDLKKDDKPIVAENQPILEFTSEAEVTLQTEPASRFEVFKELEHAIKLDLRDLDQPRGQELFKQTLRYDKTFHLDLTCPVTAQGLDQLQAIFQKQGVQVLIEKAALARSKKGLKTHYAIYTEDLIPEELIAILQALRKEEKKADPKQRFNKIVINHLTPANRKEICTLLGVDPRTMAAKPKGPLGVDLTQPLSKKTEVQVADSLAGKGTPRPEPGKPVVPKGPDRLALVLSYNPVRVSPTSSKEIKQFLATRPGQRPGALQILLVLRGS
jgi:hypothetical protein